MALALVVLAAGCGTSNADKFKQSVARVNCLSRAQAVAQTNLVRAAYARGQVGSAAYLRSHVFGNRPRREYLDTNGQLKSLFAMPRGAQDEFLAWVFQLDGSNRWADRIDAAGRRAQHAATCPKA